MVRSQPTASAMCSTVGSPRPAAASRDVYPTSNSRARRRPAPPPALGDGPPRARSLQRDPPTVLPGHLRTRLVVSARTGRVSADPDSRHLPVRSWGGLLDRGASSLVSGAVHSLAECSPRFLPDTLPDDPRSLPAHRIADPDQLSSTSAASVSRSVVFISATFSLCSVVPSAISSVWDAIDLDRRSARCSASLVCSMAVAC